jgi:hypothetical protein
MNTLRPTVITARPTVITAPPEGWIYFQGPIPREMQRDTSTDLMIWRRPEQTWAQRNLNGSSPTHYAVLAGSPTAIRIGLSEAPVVQPNPHGLNPLPEGYIYARGPLKRLPDRAREKMLAWLQRTSDGIWEWREDMLSGQSNLHYGVPAGGPMAIANGLFAMPQKTEKPKLTTKQLILHYTREGRHLHIITECTSDPSGITGKGLIKTILQTLRKANPGKMEVEPSKPDRLMQALICVWGHSRDSWVWATSPKYLKELDPFIKSLEHGHRHTATERLIIFPKHLGVTQEQLDGINKHHLTTLLVL